MFVGILISGCNSNFIEHTSDTIPSATTTVSTVIQPVIQPVITDANKSENTQPSIMEKSSDQATVASNTSEHAIPTDAAESSQPAFSTKQPKLMGLAIGELQEKVSDMYGKPLESYTMEDPIEPIAVYSYEGFSIGFNAKKEIQFIDVNSTKVNPELNGLRIGQSSAQALEVIGKPYKNTSYVISYNTKAAILKLDIDPKTKTIQSIKLFAVNA